MSKKAYWNQPSRGEIDRAVNQLGGQSKVANMLKKSRSTVFGWCGERGRGEIDYANWKLIKNFLNIDVYGEKSIKEFSNKEIADEVKRRLG